MSSRKPRPARSVAPPSAGEAIRAAVKHAGGPTAVAVLLKRTANAIGFWYHQPQRLDAVVARELCRMSGFQVSLSMMRPDVFAGLSVRELGYTPPMEPRP